MASTVASLEERAASGGRFPWPLPKRAWERLRGSDVLRVGTYNIRVDHDADDGSGHEWALRRPLAARAIRRLNCDILLLQEPGLPAAEELGADLSDDGYRVATMPCDPSKGPGRGQAYDGNGFAWRPDRVELLGELDSFWLSERPEAPGGPAWDASPFQRTGVSAAFRDRATGDVWHCISAHLDHVGVQARIESCKLLAARAARAPATHVVVGGDFNTFPTAPEIYRGLEEAASTVGLVDVRTAAATTYDFGAGGASWAGWPGDRFCRAENIERHGDLGQDASRFDHLFVRRGSDVACTGVVEEDSWAGASDHVPIVAEFRTPPGPARADSDSPGGRLGGLRSPER